MAKAREPKTRDQIEEGRINVYVSPEARRMMAELAGWLHPGRKRTDGLVVEQALRELYAREKHKHDGQD